MQETNETGEGELAEYQSRLSEAGIESDYRAVLVRGVPQNPMFDIRAFEAVIDGFRAKDEDVFVATYVKAGTTWVQQILHGLLRGGESGGRYGESVPWLEACASSPEVIGPREAPGWTMEEINAAPGPRYFKTHAKVEDLPRGDARPRVICVARNPKDTVVSLYHHARNKPEFGFSGDFETFLRIFLSDLAENGSWFDHVLGWYQECRRHPETHLFLKYEDLHDDTAAVVQQLADAIVELASILDADPQRVDLLLGVEAAGTARRVAVLNLGLRDGVAACSAATIAHRFLLLLLGHVLEQPHSAGAVVVLVVLVEQVAVGRPLDVPLGTTLATGFEVTVAGAEPP